MPPSHCPFPFLGHKLSQGDRRLIRIHYVHPPKSGGTSFGQIVIAAACELNEKYRPYLNCCQRPALWCGKGAECEPLPGCDAIYGCTLCHCHHIPRMQRMKDAHLSITIMRHPIVSFWCLCLWDWDSPLPPFPSSSEVLARQCPGGWCLGWCYAPRAAHQQQIPHLLLPHLAAVDVHPPTHPPPPPPRTRSGS